MSIKQVDTERLAREIKDVLDCYPCGKIEEAIEAHDPIEENIVRPADVVLFGGRKAVVIRRCDYVRLMKSLAINEIGAWRTDMGYFRDQYHYFTTPNGRPVTGYEDD